MIVDVRLVRTRDGRCRVVVEGQAIGLEFASPHRALKVLAESAHTGRDVEEQWKLLREWWS